MTTQLIEAARQALEALQDTLSGDLTPYQATKTITALRAALEQPAQGCDYCNHPQYAGIKCKNCGRMTEQPAQDQPVGYFSVNDYGRWEENEGTYGEPLYDRPKPCPTCVALARAVMMDQTGKS